MKLPKIHSITKKLLVGCVGGFLLLFLLFHMTANLFILRHDDGAWYSAFCHFMGSNWVVKIFEIVLLAVFLLHIVLTLWLAITNRMARPVRYHEQQRSKTHQNSKLMMITGILIFCLLIVHFFDFYFVKIGLVKGEYMVEVEKIQTDEVMTIHQYATQQGMTPNEFVDAFEAQVRQYSHQLTPVEQEQIDENIAELRRAVPVAELFEKAFAENNFSADHKWIRHITYDERQMLRQNMPECGVEPDFYYRARDKFSHWYTVLIYLVFFAVIYLHLSHAFPSVFQTFGLNNYKYNKAIEVLGKIYTWVLVIGFAAVPILVFLGL